MDGAWKTSWGIVSGLETASKGILRMISGMESGSTLMIMEIAIWDGTRIIRKKE